MDPKRVSERIKTAQDASGDPASASEELGKAQLPNDFANRAGWLATINQVTQIDTPRSYPGIDVLSVINQPGGIRARMMIDKAINVNDPEFSQAIHTLGGKEADTYMISDLRVTINNLSGENQYDPNQAQQAAAQLNGYATNGSAAAAEIKRLISADNQFRTEVNKMKQQTFQRGVPVPAIRAEKATRTIIAQFDPAPPADMVPPAEGQQGDPSNPLSVDKFTSVEHLRETLIQLGPKPETYSKIFDLVGADNEDSAKDALVKFYEGSPNGLCVLYNLLIEAGVASPIDEQTIGDLMQNHPEVFKNEEGTPDDGQQQPVQASAKVTLKKGSKDNMFVMAHDDGRTITAKNEWDYATIAKTFGWEGEESDVQGAKNFLETSCGKTASASKLFDKYTESVNAFNGLYMSASPCNGCGMQKTASGGVGSTTPQSYSMGGPDDKRMCPKIRNVVNTFTCRYHCLDGLAIDDGQILCGEAIWRKSVMDKFSREYRDADGNWVGGYLNNRFEIDRTTYEHPYQLEPGQRMAPINEDAWSTEKRLQEMRRDEGKSRGYSETPGDPKSLYNFDQHELIKGPKSPDLSGKDKDKIAKLASTNQVEVKVAQSFFDSSDLGLQKIDSTEVGGDVREHGIQMIKDKLSQGMPFSEDEVRTIVGTGAAAEEDFVPEAGGFSYRKHHTVAKVFNLSKKAQITPMQGGSQAMGDYDRTGQRGTKCLKCGKKGAMGESNCPICGGKMGPLYMSEILNETGAMPKPSIAASTSLTISYANGVYRATKDGRSAFGATIIEAQEKLRAMDVAKTKPGTVQEEANKLMNIIQDTAEEMDQHGPIQQPVPGQVVPQPVANQGQNIINPAAPQGTVVTQPDLHVDASDLDEHLMHGSDSENPEDRKGRTEEFASYGLE